MTTLIFVRHGQSVSNLLRVFAGQMEFDLTELGMRQAELVADFLKNNIPLNAVYASDLRRTMQTAEPTAKRFGLEIIPMAELRERALGKWEGKTNKEVAEMDPEFYERWRRRQGGCPVGAEHPDDYRERALRAERRILAENRGKTAAVFTHVGIINALADVWKKTLPELCDILVYGNSSITAIEYDDEGVARRVVLKNYQEHLGNDATELPAHLL